MKQPNFSSPSSRRGPKWPRRKAAPGTVISKARRRRLKDFLSRDASGKARLRFSPVRIFIGICTAALLSALLCIHLWPNTVSLRLGDISDREIVAQRTVRYHDTAATRTLRDDAVLRVGKQYEPIADASASALDAVRAVFDTIDHAAHTAAAAPPPAAVTPNPNEAENKPLRRRAGEEAEEFARQTAAEVRRQAGISLPRNQVARLLKEDAASREQVRIVTMRVVEHAMNRSITDDSDELANARREIGRDGELARIANPDVRNIAASIARVALMPTRRFDARQTERERQAARNAVPAQMRRLTAGTSIVRSGDRVNQQHLDAFAALGLQNARLDALTISVISTMVSLLVALVSVYLFLFHNELYRDTPRLFLLCLLCVISVIGLKIGSTLLGLPLTGVQFGYLGMMCVASAGMVIALLISPRVATLIVALLSVASGLILNNELRFTLITLGSSLVGIVSVATLRNRNELLRAALFLCGSNALLNVLVGQLEGDVPSELVTGLVWGVISGLFALVLFYVGVAVFEKPFGITTHLRLLELSDPATPILQEFRLRVPGTYAHSLMVGNLAHAAAEAIGADGLLVRVAAYYHDLGKMNRPDYFTENQNALENAHDRMAPSLSAVVLASHVKDGLEMCDEIKLPPLVREIIQQHHGTSLMKFFYHRATGGVPNPALEAQFRYAGPKPQTKEAAILMLADTVEAASRTLERPTPARISDFVARLVEDKRADGQLDECDLTLRDLKTIESIFARTLSGTLHGRVSYPGDKQAAAPGSTPPFVQTIPLALTINSGENTPTLTLSHADQTDRNHQLDDTNALAAQSSGPAARLLASGENRRTPSSRSSE